MATWWVRPDTSHSATRDGTSYATAWGGWSAIVWGGAGVVGGDTLMVCGTHTLSANAAVGAHGGSSEATRCVIRGDYGADPGIVTSATSGGFYLNNGSRQYTDIVGLTLIGNGGRSLNIGNGAHYTRILSCSITGDGSAQVVGLPVANGNSLTDLVIEDCDFYGSCGSQGVISQFVTAAGATVNLTRAAIRGNRFNGVSSPRSIIHLRADTGAAAYTRTDLVIESNFFDGCAGIPIEVNSAFNVYGLNTGIKVRHNVMRNCAFAFGSTLLGGNVVRGFAPSTTPGFGRNEIAYNILREVYGQYGGFNLFFGEYWVHHNDMDGIYTETIDGNGVLLDHGNQRAVVERNTFKRARGKSGVNNSGCAVMVLDSTDCNVRFNVSDECAVGVYIGAESHPDTGDTPNQSVEVDNNTLLQCQVYGFRLQSDAADDNPARNNVVTGPGAAVSSGVTWTGESNNRFYGMAAAIGHTLHASSSTADPKINANGVPLQCSTILTQGSDLGYIEDIQGIKGRAFIGAYTRKRIGPIGNFAQARLEIIRQQQLELLKKQLEEDSDDLDT